MHKALSMVVPLCVALFCGCTRFSPVAGGSSQQGNGRVVGRVVDTAGVAVAHVKVALLSALHDPLKDNSSSDSLLDTTDASGGYSIAGLGAGNFTLEAVNCVTGQMALVTGITVTAAKTDTAPQAVLQAPGFIRVEFPDTFAAINGYVYLPGTTSFGLVVNHRAITGPVPAGIIRSVNFSTTGGAAAVVVRRNVPILPGEIAVIYNPFWQYACRLYLNTTTSGAGVSDAVTGFPLLVRLPGGGFSFGQAKRDGSDLLFTNANGAPLPYEIERWDSASGSAAVWVKADTVRGNCDSQYVAMYWGNENALSQSNGAAVFGAAQGFAGVWHLDSACADATGNGNGGTYSGTIDTVGMIGRCQRFNGAAYAEIAGLLKTPAVITLSAWACLDSADISGSEVVSIGDAVLIRMDDPWQNNGCYGAYHTPAQCNQTKSGIYLNKTGWHYLAFAVDAAGGKETMYIDGAQSAISDSTTPITYTGVGTDTYIGKHGNGKTGFEFTGNIDEVRIDNTARSAAWIKLCYMNQRADDALVVFKQ